VFSIDYIAKLLENPSASPQAFAGQSLARCDAEPLRYWVLGLVAGRKVCSEAYETVNVTAELASAD